MELKLCSRSQFRIRRLLLIVPYGIETKDLSYALAASSLLIVPYGIETRKAHRNAQRVGTF